MGTFVRSSFSTHAQSRRRGITLIEMITVVGILALLMAITLPAISGVRQAGRMTVEQNAARQLMVAYIAYANVNQERVMPGYAPPSFAATDTQGKPISMGPARQRYFWRIAPYLSGRTDALFLHEQRELIEEAKHTSSYDMYLYHASYAPSFGINARWVGGDYSTSANPPACLEQDMSKQPCATYNALFGRFWISRITQPRTPDRLIVFASARGPTPLESWGTNNVEGYFKVESPRFTNEEPTWAESFSANLEPAQFGFVSPRYRGRAVIGFMDGRTGLLGEDELTDMRYWADQADDAEWFMEANVP